MQRGWLQIWSSQSRAALVVLAQAALLAVAADCAFAEEIRYVPQLGLTELAPTKVAYNPSDAQTLMVVNRNGRIDLLDISDPKNPIKKLEIYAGALDAAFNPAGDRIVSGGSGKSALAFHAVRKTLAGRRHGPVPVLVDEDWEGSLAAQVAGQLRLAEWDRGPTEAMAKTLGAAGLVCPLVDSLSERAMGDAEERVGKALSEGHFRHLIVTSREAPPQGQVWQWMDRVSTHPLSQQDAPAFVAAYTPEERRAEVEDRIAPLVNAPPMPSPLFLRFAIEQALEGALGSTEKLDLVLHYVEALRAGRVDLNPDDMARAAAITAVEAVRESESLAPHEIEQPYLRGVLVSETDGTPFMDAQNAGNVDPAAVIDILVSSGLLNRNRTNRRLQFAYDPVAEYLAAWRVLTARKEAVAEIKARIVASPKSAVGRAFNEIEARG